MMFWKSNTIKLRCFTNRADIFETAQVTKAVNFLPEWWKGLPKSIPDPTGLFPNPTMKHCVGFIEYFRKSIVVPFWSDLALAVGPVGTEYFRWQFSDRMSEIEIHAGQQRGSFLDSNLFQNVKIDAPWRFVCDEPIQWVLNGAFWTTDAPDQLLFPPGFLDFNYQREANLNFFIRRNLEEQKLLIPAFSPAVFLVPLTDKKVIVECELVSEDKFRQLSSLGVANTFINNYLNKKRAITSTQNESKKCPFARLW